MLTLILLSLIWGSSYILIKWGLAVFDPLQLGALRLTISGLAFLPFLIVQLRKIAWGKWPVLLLVGLTGTGLPSVLFPMAQQGISSSLAGILNSLTPLFTFLFGLLFFRAGFAMSRLLGVLIGLAGAVLLVVQTAGGTVSGGAGFALLAVLGSCCYAISSNAVGTYLRRMPSLTISAVSFSMVAAPSAVYLFGFTDFTARMQQVEGACLAFGYVALLALFSTVLASVIFFRLIQWTSALFASSVSYLVPAVAVLWGVLDGEGITFSLLTGMALILLGVYINRYRGGA